MTGFADGAAVLSAINFASYNYLGLSGDPDVTRAAQDAVARWGSSVSASRVVSGERPVHAALESEIARFIGVDDALVYIGGHPANVSTISHLFNRDDVILCDGDQLIDVMRKGGQGVLNVLAIGGVKSDLDSTIVELSDGSKSASARRAM